MRRTDRLFELIQLFRGGRLWRGRDLAERLEVSLRTIYRDLDTLTASGVPIEGERGLGYMLREPIFIPPLTLTTLELEALHLGMHFVSHTGDETLSEAARQLKIKIDAVLPSNRQGKNFAKGIGIYAPTPEGPHVFLPLLREAIRQKQKLNLIYHRLDGKTTKRLVRPLHLEFWGSVWTLTAWCERRDDFRTFRVDRIKAAKQQGHFRSEPGKRFTDFLERFQDKWTPVIRPETRQTKI